MGRLFKNIVWLWLFSLLTATVGVSVHFVYCYCIGKTTQSVFIPTDACAAKFGLEKPDCCKKTTRSCCEKTPEKHGCTKKTTQVFQLKTEFTAEDFPGKKLDFPVLPALSVEPFFVKSLSFPNFQTAWNFSDSSPPFVLSGKAVCVLYGCFRC